MVMFAARGASFAARVAMSARVALARAFRCEKKQPLPPSLAYGFAWSIIAARAATSAGAA